MFLIVNFALIMVISGLVWIAQHIDGPGCGS